MTNFIKHCSDEVKFQNWKFSIHIYLFLVINTSYTTRYFKFEVIDRVNGSRFTKTKTIDEKCVRIRLKVRV